MICRNVAVIGCGHVGLVTAAGFAHLGHRVIGLDVKQSLVEALNSGTSPFVEPGLEDLLRQGLDSGRLSFTLDHSVAVADAEFIFLTVDTPTTQSGAADLSNIRAATRSISPHLAGASPIIVNKSTSPVGSGETIASIVRAGLAAGGHEPRIVSNPEFLREGEAVNDFLNPDRIVVGSASTDDAHAVADLYGSVGPAFVTDLRTAEMIKYVANSYLATRISFANEIARLCEVLGTEVDDVLHGAGLDGRIGTHYFQPGLGYGGSCLPKDTAALRFVADLYGVTTPVLAAVDSVNRSRPVEVIRRLRTELGDLSGKRFGVWGVTFKGDTDDTRESPALAVIRALMNEEAELAVFDPAAPEDVPAKVAEVMVGSALDAARDADAVLILTDWAQFKDAPLQTVAQLMRGRLLLDGRNMLDPAAVVAAGLTYVGMGRRIRVPDRQLVEQR